MVQATINSRKHIVQTPKFTAGMSGKVEVDIAIVDAAPSSPNQVREGAVIKAVYLEYWFLSEDMNVSSFVTSLEKRTSGATQMTFGESNALDNYDNKKGVFYISQGLLGEQNSNPTPVMRQWFKIPKGKQRFAIGDVLTVNFTANTTPLSICGFALFKEYY